MREWHRFKEIAIKFYCFVSVPEKLRAILRETESIAEERTDFPLRAESSSESTPAVKKQSISSISKRGRKARNDGSQTFNSEVSCFAFIYRFTYIAIYVCLHAHISMLIFE